MLFKEILKPEAHLFYQDEETGSIWFYDITNYKKIAILETVGKICGLALYNSMTINLPFPLALFKVIIGIIKLCIISCQIFSFILEVT